MILALLLLVGVLSGPTFSPKSPTIGDLVTIEFPGPVKLEASRDYEVISNEGPRVVVRTFEPKPFEVRGTVNGAAVRVRIPVVSVLKPGDQLNPAPLSAPRATPHPREPFIAIALAALAAVLALVLVFVSARLRAAKPLPPPMSADERFRRAVLELQTTRSWGRLADETRIYLAATRPRISTDLTTTELVPRLQEREKFVAHILRQGDVEKFSRRKPDAGDFDEAARKALELVQMNAPPAEAAP